MKLVDGIQILCLKNNIKKINKIFNSMQIKKKERLKVGENTQYEIRVIDLFSEPFINLSVASKSAFLRTDLTFHLL